MTNSTNLHVGLLVERRYLTQAQPQGLKAALLQRDCEVSEIDPDAAAHDLADSAWLRGLDLIVCRGRSWELLSLLTWAEAWSVAVINRRAAIASVHNKGELSVTLTSANLPTPRT